MTIFESTAAEEILQRTDRLSPDAKAMWGKMNAGQMMCHLADGLRMATGELKVADTSSFLTRTVLKQLVLHVLPFPKNVPTLRELDQMRDGTPAAEFEADRTALKESLRQACSCGDDFAWASHGKFGPLNRKQWGILAYKHFDHHLKQFGV